MKLETHFFRACEELARAEQAQREGNDGMARVCARRAVGALVECWMTVEPDPRFGTNTLSALRGLAEDERSPENVRRAANLLLHGVRAKDTENFPHTPIEEAKTIIEYVRGKLKGLDRIY